MKCANPCPPGTFHIDCKKTCDCYNSAVCDHVTGRCHCRPGFKGDKVRLEGGEGNTIDLSCVQCSEQCPYGRYGAGCQQVCRCENGAHCDPVDGSCRSVGGWNVPAMSDVCAAGVPRAGEERPAVREPAADLSSTAPTALSSVGVIQTTQRCK